MSSFFSSATAASSSSLPPTVAALRLLTAVPSGLRRSTALARPKLVRQNGKYKSRGPKGAARANQAGRQSGMTTSSVRQQSLAVGNDGRLPWTRPLRDLSEIRVTLLCDPGLLFTSSVVATTYAGVSFALSDLAKATDLTDVFDEYRFDSIEVMIIPNVTEATVAGTGPGILGSAVDIDDANTPTAISNVSQHEGAIESGGTMSHYHRWDPTYAVATYSGAFTSYSAARGWVDCGSPSVQHFGLKAFVTSTGTATGFSILKRYTISFRGLH